MPLVMRRCELPIFSFDGTLLVASFSADVVDLNVEENKLHTDRVERHLFFYSAI